jgi:hypothetical protein
MAAGARMRQAGLMIIDVGRIAGDGSIRHAVVDTAGPDDAARSCTPAITAAPSRRSSSRAPGEPWRTALVARPQRSSLV